MSEYRPLVAFEDASQSYVNGFEAGMVWREMELAMARLGTGECAVIERTVHIENMTTLARMTDALGWSVHFESAADGWLFMRAERKTTRSISPLLRLVRRRV